MRVGASLMRVGAKLNPVGATLIRIGAILILIGAMSSTLIGALASRYSCCRLTTNGPPHSTRLPFG
jgi:hypothetical protein